MRFNCTSTDSPLLLKGGVLFFEKFLKIQISIYNTLASEKQEFQVVFHQCYCLTGGVYVGFGTWLCMEHPIQHE